ncbi:hypothetical protein ACFL6A_00935 [bacterium]
MIAVRISIARTSPITPFVMITAPLPNSGEPINQQLVPGRLLQQFTHIILLRRFTFSSQKQVLNK